MADERLNPINRFIDLQKNTSVGEVVSSITHKVNNYLFLLINYATFLEGNDDLKKKIAHVVEEMSMYMRSIRERTGRDYQWSDHSYSAIISEVLTFEPCWKFLNPDSKIVQNAAVDSVVIHCDREQLVSALSEIISFAVQHTKTGDVEIKVYCEDDMIIWDILHEHDGSVKLPELIQDPFSNATNEQINLGMAFCKRTAEKHAGVFQVKQEGKFCSQKFIIPILKTEGE